MSRLASTSHISGSPAVSRSDRTRQPRRSQTRSPAGSPAVAAWIAAGRPTPPTAELPEQGEWCCCCGATDVALVAALSVVSRKFTDADSWVYGGDWLCVACGWTYGTAELRRSVYLIDQHRPAHTVVERAELGEMLAAGPLPADRIAVIPVRGRRHILPTARWGHVCTDDTAIRWDDAAVSLLTDLRWLRTQPGLRAVMLAEPVPPMPVIRALPADQWPRLLEAWDALTVWRTHPGAWWDAAIALSTPVAPAATTRRAG